MVEVSYAGFSAWAATQRADLIRWQQLGFSNLGFADPYGARRDTELHAVS